MLGAKEIRKLSDANERVVAKQFKKLGYVVEKLDRKSSKRARPDFLIKDRDNRPQMVCEVKTIVSGGFLPDKGFHMSTRDPNLGAFQLLRKDVNLRNMDEDLSDAVRKRSTLVEDEPKYQRLPLLVAFFFDLYANFLRFYEGTFDENISGIVTVKRDETTRRAFEQLSPAEQERRLFDPRWENGLPTSGKGFVLVPNRAARRVIPKDFQLRCITDTLLD